MSQVKSMIAFDVKILIFTYSQRVGVGIITIVYARKGNPITIISIDL